MLITPFYAALLGLMFIVLSVRTLRTRRTLRIAVGDDGNQQMLRTMRVHANFAEYTPIALLLVYFFELLGGYQSLTHLFCICLLAGRISHAYGLSQLKENYKYRIFGMAMTFTAIVSASVGLLFLYVRQVTG
ncbi:MAG: MAPEG family protein [Burkholderiales bacterium]